MDLIKKHYEKILLALTLLILIASAAMLSHKVGALSAEVQAAPHLRKPKGKTIESLDLGSYSNALTSLQQPPLWTNSPAWIFSPGSETAPPDDTGMTTNDLPVLIRVAREPFKLLFMTYTGEGRSFQLNFLTRARTFMVPEVGMEVGDKYFKTGYFIKKFEKKKTEVTPANPREKDVSELTIQHEGEDPIVLVVGLITEQREPVAWVRCKASPQPQPVRRGQRLDCGIATYNVVDITSKQMIIIDEKTAQRHEIPLSAPK